MPRSAKTTPFSPATQNFLPLAKIKNLNVIGFGRVVGDTDRCRLVLSAAEIATANPGAGAAAAVISETKPLRDFQEIWRASGRQLGAGGTGLQFDGSGGTWHRVGDLQNFSKTWSGPAMNTSAQTAA